MNCIIPNFLGIGAMKSGTTWIAEILSVHPDIFVAHGKELHYFSHKYNEGIDWYLSKFRTAKNQKAIGEYSVSYMMNSDVVSKRIYDFNPKIKLIVAIRNPVDRAFSLYRFQIQRGRILPNFPDAIKAIPGLISEGLYFQKMKPYWDLFSDEQIHFVLYDDIMNKVNKVQKNLYRFLEVDDNFDSGLTNTVIGKTITPRIRSAEVIRNRIHSWAMQHNIPFLITWVKKSGISRFYRRINDKAIQNITLAPEDRKRIYSYFADDLNRFRDRIGLDISSWCLEN